MKLANKISVITGAASGMGQAAAILFSREGSKVVACDIDDAGLARTRALILEAGGDVLSLHCDVGKSADVESMVSATVERYGAVHILYNNAGRLDAEDGFLTEVPTATWDAILVTNLKSVFLCCKYSIPVMLRSGGGSIINTASVSAFKAGVGTAYGASKGGVVALTRNIAKQYGPTIRANCVVPGAIDTRFADALKAKSEVGQQGPTFSAVPTPAGRSGKPEEVGRAALFLASDDSSYVTGAALTVDGGFLAV